MDFVSLSPFGRINREYGGKEQKRYNGEPKTIFNPQGKVNEEHVKPGNREQQVHVTAPGYAHSVNTK